MYDQVLMPEPKFGSTITKNILKLEKLRNEDNILYNGFRGVGGNIFLGLKSIFQIVESVSSARIEGNRTTVIQFVKERHKKPTDVTGKQKQKEIDNIYKGIGYIEEYKRNCETDDDFKINNTLLSNLHQILMDELLVGDGHEGDHTPGIYRNFNVEISKSNHISPDYTQVNPHMDALLDFINSYKSDNRQFDLIRIAIAHHRFVRIHPYGNGNGRMVRLLTYAMLIKYGYDIGHFGLLNPSTLFCLERDKYYNYLNNADSGEADKLLEWCDYCIEGIANEMDKLELLCDKSFVVNKILKNALKYLVNIGLIDDTEEKILKILYNNRQIVAKDIIESTNLHPTTVSVKLRHLKELDLIGPKYNKKTIYEAKIDKNTEMFNAIFHELGNNGFDTWLDLEKIT